MDIKVDLVNTQLKLEDQYHVTSSLPSAVVRVLKEFDTHLNGGYIRCRVATEPIDDIDICIQDVTQLVDIEAVLTEDGYCVDFQGDGITQLSKSGTYLVQLIYHETYKSPEALLNTFPFSICQACVWHDGKWKSMVNVDFYNSVRKKVLAYNINHKMKWRNLYKVTKYAQKGYTIDALEFSAMLKSILRDREGKTISEIITELEKDLDRVGYEDFVKESS